LFSCQHQQRAQAVSSAPRAGNIALFTAYDSAQVKQALTVGVHHPTVLVEKSNAALSARQKAGGMEISYSTASAGPATLLAHDLKDQ
jgi:hypothetical protein